MKMINTFPVLMGLTVIAFAFSAEVDGPEGSYHHLRQQASSEDGEVSQPSVAQPRHDQKLNDGIDLPLMGRKKNKKEFTVSIGDYNRKVKDEEEQNLTVDKMIIHPNYTANITDSDIALLKVRRNDGLGMTFNQYVKPAHLPHRDTPYTTGTLCEVSGWGDTKASLRPGPKLDGESRYVLRWASIPLVSEEDCRKEFPTITPRMVCAGGRKSSCRGDSGGPLVCKLNRLPTLMGVVSFGWFCGEPGFPSVYAKVSEFVPWIDETIQTE